MEEVSFMDFVYQNPDLSTEEYRQFKKKFYTNHSIEYTQYQKDFYEYLIEKDLLNHNYIQIDLLPHLPEDSPLGLPPFERLLESPYIPAFIRCGYEIDIFMYSCR